MEAGCSASSLGSTVTVQVVLASAGPFARKIRRPASKVTAVSISNLISQRISTIRFREHGLSRNGPWLAQVCRVGEEGRNAEVKSTAFGSASSWQMVLST